jgi:hypothetical protein
MLQSFTITVRRSNGQNATYALTSHKVRTPRGERTNTYFTRVGGVGLSPFTFTVVENYRLGTTDDQLADIARAMVRIMGYSVDEAADYMAGFAAEALELSGQQTDAMRRRLRAKQERE